MSEVEIEDLTSPTSLQGERDNVPQKKFHDDFALDRDISNRPTLSDGNTLSVPRKTTDSHISDMSDDLSD